jgi:hypothetical protein
MPENLERTGLFAGDKIRIEGNWGRVYIRRVEVFRDCLGVFLSDQARTMGKFTPLCDLYGFGAGSSHGYMSNHGEYVKNPVALWAQVPSDTPEE